LAVDPNNAVALGARVGVYLLQRRFEQARTQAEASLRTPGLVPFGRAQLRLSLAGIYLEKGEIDKAVSVMSDMPAGAEDLPRVVAFRALLDVHNKNLAQAEGRLQRLLKGQPNNLGLRATLGWVQAEQGHVEQALPVLEELRRNEVLGRNPVFLDNLGDVYVLAKAPDKARGAWQEALRVFPKTAEPGDRRKAAIEGKLKELER
jgi:predicted Zn-dependent protease